MFDIEEQIEKIGANFDGFREDYNKRVDEIEKRMNRQVLGHPGGRSAPGELVEARAELGQFARSGLARLPWRLSSASSRRVLTYSITAAEAVPPISSNRASPCSPTISALPAPRTRSRSSSLSDLRPPEAHVRIVTSIRSLPGCRQ